MDRLFRPHPHADVNVVVEHARRGDAFFVNRAARNGDLAQLPENEQRRIVAEANDRAAKRAMDLTVPLDRAGTERLQEFVDRREDLAVRVFTREGGRDVKDQIKEYYGD
jgi:hypothetical protein